MMNLFLLIRISKAYLSVQFAYVVLYSLRGIHYHSLDQGNYVDVLEHSNPFPYLTD